MNGAKLLRRYVAMRESSSGGGAQRKNDEWDKMRPLSVITCHLEVLLQYLY